MELSTKHCIPCEGNIPAMPEIDEDNYLSEVKGWEIEREGIHKLRKEFKFKDFKQAMAFVNQVAEIAEYEGHHPDIYIYYNTVVLELYTHAVKGLFQNDFILASKINDLMKSSSQPAKKKK